MLFQFVPHRLDVLRVERGQVLHPPLQIRDPDFKSNQPDTLLCALSPPVVFFYTFHQVKPIRLAAVLAVILSNSQVVGGKETNFQKTFLVTVVVVGGD